MAEPEREIILRRPCKIEPIGGGEPQELVVTFYAPVLMAEGKRELRADITSPYFRQEVAVLAEEPRELADLIDLVLAILQNRCDEGYRIYFFNREELDVENFWRLGVNRENILRNVILKRTYKISEDNDDPGDLTVEILRSYENLNGSSVITVRLTCPYFTKTQDMNGADDFDAVRAAQGWANIYIGHRLQNGLKLFLFESGDIDPSDIWAWPLGETTSSP